MPVPSTDELDLLHSHICQAIGEPKRIQILYALADSPRNVSELAKLLDTPQPTISRHLSVLRQRHLAIPQREGTTITYHLAEPRIIEVLDAMRSILRSILERQSISLSEEGAAE